MESEIFPTSLGLSLPTLPRNPARPEALARPPAMGRYFSEEDSDFTGPVSTSSFSASLSSGTASPSPTSRGSSSISISSTDFFEDSVGTTSPAEHAMKRGLSSSSLSSGPLASNASNPRPAGKKGTRTGTKSSASASSSPRPKGAANPEIATGRWTDAEHQAFLLALGPEIKKTGNEWKKIALSVPTRSVVQVRTHAQKFFLRPHAHLNNVNPAYADAATPAPGRVSPTSATKPADLPAVSTSLPQATVDSLVSSPTSSPRKPSNSRKRAESSTSALESDHSPLRAGATERPKKRAASLNSMTATQCGNGLEGAKPLEGDTRLSHLSRHTNPALEDPGYKGARAQRSSSLPEVQLSSMGARNGAMPSIAEDVVSVHATSSFVQTSTMSQSFEWPKHAVTSAPAVPQQQLGRKQQDDQLLADSLLPLPVYFASQVQQQRAHHSRPSYMMGHQGEHEGLAANDEPSSEPGFDALLFSFEDVCTALEDPLEPLPPLETLQLNSSSDWIDGDLPEYAPFMATDAKTVL